MLVYQRVHWIHQYPWRIHGAGIYANINGVYWWDPWSTIYSSSMDPSWDINHLWIMGAPFRWPIHRKFYGRITALVWCSAVISTWCGFTSETWPSKKKSESSPIYKITSDHFRSCFLFYLSLLAMLFPLFPHGSLNVPIEHHPTIRYMVYNGYYKVMSNIPKMGHLPTPVPCALGCGCRTSFRPWIPFHPSTWPKLRRFRVREINRFWLGNFPFKEAV